ncbi:MAG: hypothetical protein KF819_26740 [Labilithrix sp.]|nr:hypothetical protein [Labilithrix sp.]
MDELFSADGGRGVRAMKAFTLVVGAAMAFLALWVIVARLLNPIDAEWMVGAVRDTVERARDGQPIYDKPSARFIAFLYPPLYYWTAGLLARVCSTFVACKVVSLTATAATLWAVARLARALGASRLWVTLAVLLQASTYSTTLFFHDLERVDSFAAAVIVVGVVVLVTAHDARQTAIGGAILGLSFFAKQPGLPVFLAAVAGLFLAGERRRAAVAALAGGAVFVALFAYLEISTGGWFRYYCVALPRTHGVEPVLLTTFLVEDVPKTFALTAASVAILLPTASAIVRRKPGGFSREEIVFAACLGAAMVGAFMLRTHRGGWANVILVWTPLASAATGIVASRLESRATSMLLLTGTSLQLLAGIFDPNDNSPDDEDVRFAKITEESVRHLEKEGEVIVTATGNLTRERHFHSAALYDVLRAGDPPPTELVENLRARKYSAIFVGSADEFSCTFRGCADLGDATLRNYFVAARLHERKKMGMVGYDERPRFILRPRKTPIVGLDHQALGRRARVEAAIADARRWAAGPDSVPVVEADIEDLAASVSP